MKNLSLRHTANAGFSMIQMSIILAVAGLVLASTLPGGEGSSDADKVRITKERMAAIENATKDYMAANGRRPFPADLTVGVDDVAFGKEPNPLPSDDIIASGDLTGIFNEYYTLDSFIGGVVSTLVTTSFTIDSSVRNGWLATDEDGLNLTAPILKMIDGSNFIWKIPYNPITTSNEFSFRNPLIAGGVPTKTLGLPDEYGLDGFGRRMVYMVDLSATNTTYCMDKQSRNEKGYLAISSSYNFDNDTYDHTMWALLSYGKDGHGAMSAQGSGDLNTRIKTGNTDDNTRENAFYNTGTPPSTQYDDVRGLVKKEATTTFDDIVWYAEDTKNTCCMGEQCMPKQDFAISAGTANPNPTSAAFGDINGDGFPDMVIGAADEDQIVVIYGRKNGWPNPPTTPGSFTSMNTGNLNGSDGFIIGSGGGLGGAFGQKVFTGDFNGDGFDDILGISGDGGTGAAIIFGAPAFTADYTIGATAPTTAIIISGLPASQATHAAIGDFNGDGMDDIALPYEEMSEKIGVVYGKASGWSDFTLNDAFFDGATGVTFLGTTIDSYLAFGDAGISAAQEARFAACDVNRDGFDDLIIPGIKTPASSYNTNMRFFIKHGKTTWANSSGDINLDSVTEPVATATINTWGITTDGEVKSIHCADINNDQYDDLIAYRENYGIDGDDFFYVSYGNASGGGGTYSGANMYSGITINMRAGEPAGFESSTSPTIVIADVNNDGLKDIVVSRPTDDPVTSSSGSVFDPVGGVDTRTNAGRAYVLYQGTTTAWASANFYATYTLDGTEGLQFVGNAGDHLIIWDVADINKDGKNDLLATSRTAGYEGFVIMGKSDWPDASSYDIGCLHDTSANHCSPQLNVK